MIGIIIRSEKKEREIAWLATASSISSAIQQRVMSSAESSFNIKSMENNKQVSTRFVMMSACSPLTGMAEALSILFP